MSSKRIMQPAIALTVLLAAAPPVLADHCCGHNNFDLTFPVPIPGRDHFDGGAINGTFIGPRGGTLITHTTFDITYVSDGATPPSDLLIEIGVQVNGDVIDFAVTGADLGFGSGAGTWKGTLETDVFNGVVWEYFGWPHSLIDLAIGSTRGGIKGSGYFVDSFITFDVVPVPAPSGLAVIALAAGLGRRRRRA